ncbi:unnamed protein product [Plutella xylostella]|uniref:(diamondback moth) hypothetical protein n=1 Tax=Plutella xylostella TaxID=51655 RepID=A0A8S4G962_PLUXY|nr:unnamed protein product [Plutella xylostella]
MVEKVVKELGLENNPERIYNIDETSYSSDPQKTKVVGRRGYPSTRTTATAGKANTTVLIASNAAGGKGPPFIIYKGKYVWSEWTSEEAYPGTLYTATKKGWIVSEAFRDFMLKSFIPMIEDKEQPTLLIFDGHSTHVQLDVIEEAKKNNITIIKLPAHTSHLLQPLDLGVFKPYKDAWDQEMVKWQRRHKGKKLPKSEFAAIVGKVWENLDPENIKNGFKKSGIYPFNRDAVPEHKLNPEAVRRWKKYNEELTQTRKTLSGDRDSPMSLAKICLDKINSNFQLNESPDTITTGDANFKTSEKLSFEDLLLESTKPTHTDNLKKKNVRISGSAEVITHQDVIQRLKKYEDDKARKEKEKDNRRNQRENKKMENKNKIKEMGKRKIVKKVPEKTRAAPSETTPPNPNLNLQDDFLPPDVNLASFSEEPLPSTSGFQKQNKVVILEDVYLKNEEKLKIYTYPEPNKIRAKDVILNGTDKKKNSEERKCDKENKGIEIEKKNQMKIKKDEEDLLAVSDFTPPNFDFKLQDDSISPEVNIARFSEALPSTSMFQKVPKNAEKEKGKKRKCDKKNKSIELKKKQKKIKKYEEDLLTDSDFTIHDTDNSDEADFESYCNTLLFQHNSDNEENVNTTFGLNDIQFFEESLFKLNKHDWSTNYTHPLKQALQTCKHHHRLSRTKDPPLTLQQPTNHIKLVRLRENVYRKTKP